MSIAQTRTVLGPGTSVTPALQLVHPLPLAANAQSFVLSWHHTPATGPLSDTLPVTVNTSLFHRCFDFGAAIVTTGFFTSAKVARTTKFDCITNPTARLVETTVTPP